MARIKRAMTAWGRYGENTNHPSRRDLSAEAPQGAKAEAPSNLLRAFASEPVLGIAEGDTRGREKSFFLLCASASPRDSPSGTPKPGISFFTPSQPTPESFAANPPPLKTGDKFLIHPYTNKKSGPGKPVCDSFMTVF